MEHQGIAGHASSNGQHAEGVQGLGLLHPERSRGTMHRQKGSITKGCEGGLHDAERNDGIREVGLGGWGGGGGRQGWSA